jgi:lysophospholipase L1-like esterase
VNNLDPGYPVCFADQVSVSLEHRKDDQVRNQLLLLSVSTVATVLIALGLIRWLAPGLLGIAPDLQLVQVSREVPPFYDNVFRQADIEQSEFILQDPIVIKRAVPLFPDKIGMGPNDILGFRNRSVPNVADIVTIGDSQTYGNNAPLELNWPSHLAAALPIKAPTVYNMSCGGWDGIQYLDIFKKALRFSPRVVVVAFYSGNDPFGAFGAAYGTDRWEDLRPDPSLRIKDAPESSWPPKQEDMWGVEFLDGTSTVFTPKARLSSNHERHPAVTAGYGVLAEIGRRIAGSGRRAGVPVVFTVIPTKELVFWPRIRDEGFSPPAEYRELIDGEAHHISWLEGKLSGLEGARFVDVVKPLQDAARSLPIYPSDSNGHPYPGGYRVIGEAIAGAADRHLIEQPAGLVFETLGPGQMATLYVQDGGKWLFASYELAAANGWAPSDGTFAESRDLAGLEYRGLITAVDPASYGPRAWR